MKLLMSRLRAPTDAASLAAFRVLFGLLMLVATVRFLFSGWIERFYGGASQLSGSEPFFFKYWGFEFVSVPSVGWIYAIYIGLAVCSLLIALGLFYRVAALAFFVGFTWTRLFDVTNYLNHDYLVCLIALLFVVVPLHRCFSLDALRKPALRSATLPTWCLWLFRFQIGCVYLFAALAKFQSDWLLSAQPLNLWLTARTDTALIGPMLDSAWVAYAASWIGFLFDATIVLWLSIRRTRRFAFIALLGFHFMTGVLFNIGMFPFIMSICATVFFAPDWARRWLGRSPIRTEVSPPRAPGRLFRVGLVLGVLYCAIQVLVPLRQLVYPGNVSWDEQGMRFSWRVMVREKHGAVTYYVGVPGKDGVVDKELQITPRRYLDRRQEREMSGQPDLILQLAHHIRDDFNARGYGDVTVRAEALVSLNGRLAQPMIDPSVDLASVKNDLSRATWILPPPTQKPPKVGRR